MNKIEIFEHVRAVCAEYDRLHPKDALEPYRRQREERQRLEQAGEAGEQRRHQQVSYDWDTLYAAIDQRLEQQLMSGKLGAPSVLI